MESLTINPRSRFLALGQKPPMVIDLAQMIIHMTDEMGDKKLGGHRVAENIEWIRLFEIGGRELCKRGGDRVDRRVDAS